METMLDSDVVTQSKPRHQRHSRACLAAGTLLFAALSLPAAIEAQVLSLPSWQPAIDLSGVSVGCWAEYRVLDGELVATQRIALVAKKPDSVVLEVRMESPSYVKPMVFRLTLPSRRGSASPAALVIDLKIGSDATIGLRSQTVPVVFADFLNPRAIVDRDELPIKSGKILATHYRHEERGEVWEYWVSPEARPTGIVWSRKTIGNLRSVFELQRTGTDVRPEIADTVRYVEPAEFARQIVGNMRSTGTR